MSSEIRGSSITYHDPCPLCPSNEIRGVKTTPLVPIRIRLPPEHKELIDALATKRRATQAETLRSLLALGLAHFAELPTIDLERNAA